MKRNRLLFLVSLVGHIAAAPALAQAQTSPGLRYDEVSIDYVVHPDGTYTDTEAYRAKVLTAEGARVVPSLMIPDSDDSTEIIIKQAYTLRADGSRIDAIPRSRTQPRAKIVGFRDPTAEDTLVLSYQRIVKKAEYPDHFVGNIYFPPFGPTRTGVITVSAPASMPIRVQASAGIKGGPVSGSDGANHWRWEVTAQGLVPDSQPAPLPYLVLSSFSNMEEQMAATKTLYPLTLPANATAGALTLPSRQPSDWFEAEKAFYQRLLSNGRFDTLIAPLQVRGDALDHATRSLMTAQLASVLQAADRGPVADTFLVERALGEGWRRLQPEEMYRLANAVGAKHLICGYVGHDRKGTLSLTITIQDRPARPELSWSTPVNSKEFEAAFTDDVPPIIAYESLLPDLALFLNVTPSRNPTPVASKIRDAPTLPTSLAEMVRPEGDPIQDAYTFELLSALTPQYLDAVRDRFAAKAYLASLRVPGSSPLYVSIRARALKALGLRPAALKLLSNPRTAEERELIAALNGDLPKISSLAAAQTNVFERLIEELDESATRADYRLKSQYWPAEAIKALKLPSKFWEFLVARAFEDSDPWLRGDSRSLKMLLDSEFPVKGYGLSDLMLAKGILGEADSLDVRVGLSVPVHVKKYLEQNTGHWCCVGSFDKPTALDMLDLFEAIARDNLIRELDLVNRTQGLPEMAMRLANALEPTLRGEPYYLLRRSEVETALALRASDAERSALQRAAYEHGVDALYYEQGQSLVASEAYGIVGGARALGNIDNVYATDRPMHAGYLPFSALMGRDPQNIDNATAALLNATSQFDAVQNLLLLYPDATSRGLLLTGLQKQIAGRFVGCPARADMLAQEARRRGDSQAAAALYRENIQISPDYWRSYYDLAGIMLLDAQPDEAARLLRSYPGFGADGQANRVAVSNDASEAAAMFYWTGRFDLAKPLYEIAAATESGSDDALSSAVRLNLMAGRLDAVMPGMLERAQRYRNAYAYRDYLGMLHVTGRSDQAWAAFAVLAKELKHVVLWETVLVGHRRGGATEQQAVEWARQKDWKGLENVRGFAALYLARFATTDRTPSAQLADIVNELDSQTWKLDDETGRVIRATSDPNFSWIIGPAASEQESTVSTAVRNTVKSHRVRSDLSYFVEGYRDLKLGKFLLAKRTFEEAASSYDVTHNDFGFLLPYLALASIKAGDRGSIEERLRAVPSPRRGFDYQLAAAVVAAASGKNDDALTALRLARYRRIHPDRRADLTQYTLAEISEEVAHMTHDPRIHDFALDWARKSQVFEPWYAWSYAIAAGLERDPDARGRAIAMAHYLDPNSERLSKLSRKEIEAAMKEFAGANPFTAKTLPPGQSAKSGALRALPLGG